MARIVILGGGFAGAYCAKELEKRLRGSNHEVWLIDRNNYFAFYPLLVEAGTGNIEPRHAVVSLRLFLRNTNFLMGATRGIDTAQQRVFYSLTGSGTEKSIPYDHLVLALGSVTRMPKVPGLRQWGFEMKSLGDAIGLRDRVVRLLEMADSAGDEDERRALLHLVVVGANFTGVEIAGEFRQLVREAVRLYKNVRDSDCRVSLVEVTDRILYALDSDLSEYAARHLQNLGIDILLKKSVSEVQPASVVMDDGEIIRSHTVIWAAGVAPNPLVKKLPVPVDKLGYILCTRDLRVRGFENVWGIGDCAVNPDPDDKPYPATAQHALKQGRHLALNICEVLDGRMTRPCDIPSRGSLAAMGGRRGVAKIGGIKLSGFPAWAVQRLFYLFKMPGWSRKLRITLDWALNLLFSREIVQLGLRPGLAHRVTRKAA